MKKKLLVGGGILVFLLPIAAFFVLRSALPPEKLLALVRPRLEAALGREVEIGGAGLSFVPLAARVDNVRVRANPGFDSPYLLELRSMHLKLRFAPLLRRQIDVRSLELTGLELTLEQDATERWNFAAARPAAAPGAAPSRPAGSPVGLQVRTLKLAGGQLFVLSAARQLELQAPLAAEIGLDVDRELRNVRVHGWVECDGLALGGKQKLHVRLEPEVQADLAAKTARIESLRLLLQDFVLEL